MSSPYDCLQCRGNGWVEIEDDRTATCPVCEGSGERWLGDPATPAAKYTAMRDRFDRSPRSCPWPLWAWATHPGACFCFLPLSFTSKWRRQIDGPVA